MIDWWMVFANGLWILGLSIVLSALSYQNWLAIVTRRRRRDLFKETRWRLLWAAGMFLTCAGFMLSQAVLWWEKALWLGFAMWFAWQVLSMITALRGRAGAP